MKARAGEPQMTSPFIQLTYMCKFGLSDIRALSRFPSAPNICILSHQSTPAIYNSLGPVRSIIKGRVQTLVHVCTRLRSSVFFFGSQDKGTHSLTDFRSRFFNTCCTGVLPPLHPLNLVWFQMNCNCAFPRINHTFKMRKFSSLL